MLADAHEYGQHLTKMLAASPFSLADQQAWASLVPSMTPAQLGAFDQILRTQTQVQAAHELEDLSVAIRATMHQRDLSLVAVVETAHQALDDIEAELKLAS